MKSIRWIVLTVLAAAQAFAAPPTEPAAATAAKTMIGMTGTRFQLLNNCSPFFVKGAVGSDALDLLAAAGANCVLAPDLAGAGGVLDKAKAAGLAAAVPVKLEQDGVLVYTNLQAVSAAIEKIRPEIRKLKTHPALVLWVIQSAVFGSEGENPQAYKAINHLARMIHEEDPDHIVVSDVGLLGDQSIKARLSAENCPEVDALGCTAEQDKVNLVAPLRIAGWQKPFVVFRVGAPLLDFANRTSWGALLEPLPAVKAAHCVGVYTNAVLSAPHSCIGAFAYSWDTSLVGSPTWYSLRTADGARLTTLDALTAVWGGTPSGNRCPDIMSVRSAVDGQTVKPGGTETMEVTATDVDNDSLTYQWVLMKELRGSDPAWFTPGEFKTIDGTIQNGDQPKASVGIPAEGGAYRLFVYVYDGKGHAASANMPFLVEGPTPAVADVIAAAPAVAPEPVVTPEMPTAAATPGSEIVVTGRPAHVEIQRVPVGGGWQLVVDGKPFFVRGAGGKSRFDELKASGANAVRTWSTDQAQFILDEAHKRGLKVCLGLWMGQERQRFNYSDRDAVLNQLEKLRSAVRRYRTHPALLMWCCGIEVEWGPGTNAAVYRAINEVAKMCHQEDPNHPTTTAFADLGYNNVKVTLATRYCPELDIFGVNSYGGLPSMADRLRAMGWTKPYMIMEFGPRGPWEQPKTEWGAEVEQEPMEKAEFYLASYLKSVSSQENWCLGSFCFYWGYKFEVTPTWFSMFLTDGSRLNPCDTMCYAWSHRAWSNHCPQIKFLYSKLDRKKVPPNQSFDLQVDAADPDGDPLAYKWVLMAEHKQKLKDGTTSTELKPVSGRVKADNQSRTQIQTPTDGGAYRLFIYVYDGKGNASTWNMPFFVEKK